MENHAFSHLNLAPGSYFDFTAPGSYFKFTAPQLLNIITVVTENCSQINNCCVTVHFVINNDLIEVTNVEAEGSFRRIMSCQLLYPGISRLEF